MFHKCNYFCEKPSAVSWRTRARFALERKIREFIPDPRNNPLTELPVNEKKYGKVFQNNQTNIRIGFRPGQSIEEYMLERDQKWLRDKREELQPFIEASNISTTKDGLPFVGVGDRERYLDVEHANAHIKEPKLDDYKVDDEILLMRRQLQLENEANYRKFISEMKRNDISSKELEKKRRPHPSDPSYDPFKITPGYRPQDSTALAQWLKRQRNSGRAATGVSLQTKEGQERFYNEEKMTTQYFANPFANRIEQPAGFSQTEITACSPDSIFINGKEVIGSCIVTEKNYYHWNVSSFEEVNERTLALLLHLYPVPDVVFIGTGRNLHQIDEDLRLAFLKRGTAVHCLTTLRALGYFTLQTSLSRRTAMAIINAIPTNGYGVECFGDFVENDIYCASDSDLGVMPSGSFTAEYLLKPNKTAEKYRHLQGTGIGPQYHKTMDGRLVRPGTSGTKLRPLIEPGESVDWEKLPSYYHWYPKENMMDYIENNTWREIRGRPTGDRAERRALATLNNEKFLEELLDTPKPDLMPWDSATIPITKFPHERNEDEIIVDDPKTGRIIGMDRATYNKWLVMMKERQSNQRESDPVEYDQERYVTNKDGVVFDLSKIKYRPIFEGRWNVRRPQSTGRDNPTMI